MNDLTTKNIGDIGEFQTCRYLESKGYTITARNVHVSKKEIDIIAERDDLIAFVEVKTRTFPSKYKQPYTSYARPAEAVTYKKRMNTIEAALGYVYQNHIDKRVRFDVCEIYFAEYPDKTYRLHKLNYIDNAFDVYGNIT
jgi:putative endonuclease